MTFWVLRLWGEVGDDLRNRDKIHAEYVLGTAVLEKLTVPQLAKLTRFKGTRRFITALTTVTINQKCTQQNTTQSKL